MKPYLIIIISTILLFAGCKREVEFKGEDIKSKIVLNSVIYVDSIIECYVYKSNTVTSGVFTIKPINTATVILSEDGIAVDTMIGVSNGKYISNTTALNNTIYQIRVSQNNYSDAIGTSQLVNKPEWIVIDSIGVISPPQENAKMTMFRMKMPKIEGETNYYSMKVFMKSMQYVFDEYYFVIDSIENYYPATVDIEYAHGIEFTKYYYDGMLGYEKLYFTDKITSQENEGSIEFPIYNSSEFGFQRNYLFIIEKVSKDLFLYEYSLSMLSDYNSIPFFSQPVQTYMNIEGGLGIVGTSDVLPYYYYPKQ